MSAAATRYYDGPDHPSDRRWNVVGPTDTAFFSLLGGPYLRLVYPSAWTLVCENGDYIAFSDNILAHSRETGETYKWRALRPAMIYLEYLSPVEADIESDESTNTGPSWRFHPGNMFRMWGDRGIEINPAPNGGYIYTRPGIDQDQLEKYPFADPFSAMVWAYLNDSDPAIGLKKVTISNTCR